MHGIVVPAEHAEAVTEAYIEAERAAAEAERIKREERALGHWRRAIVAFTVARRLLEQYGSVRAPRERARQTADAEPEQCARQLIDRPPETQPEQGVRQLIDLPEPPQPQPPQPQPTGDRREERDASRIIPIEELMAAQAPKRRRIVLRRRQ